MSLQLQNVLKPEKDQKQGYQTPRTIFTSVAIIVVVVVMKKVFYSQARCWNAIMALRVYQEAVLLVIGKGFSDVIISLLTDSLNTSNVREVMIVGDCSHHQKIFNKYFNAHTSLK